MDATEQDRATLRAWIRASLEEKGVTPTRAARESGIATTTLTKFLNDPSYKFTPSTTVLAKLERFFGRAVPRAAQGANAVPQLEAVLVEPDELPAPRRAAVAALVGDRKHVEPWIIMATSLQAAGVMPGDVVLVDMDEDPMFGDVVCAEIHEMGTKRTVFRLYQKPFLVVATFNPVQPSPIMVDDRNVVVRGVVTDRLAKARGS